MNNCPICQSVSFKLRPFANRKNEALSLLECSSCHQEFLSPWPSDEWLSEEYSMYYTKRQSGLVHSKKNYFKKLFYDLNVQMSGKKILEFGPGEGDAIVALQSLFKNTKITAVERNEEANELFQKLDCKYFNLFLEEYISKNPDQEKFDFILLFDVLEHLKDPLKTLKDLKNYKMNSGGVIIATFPVSDSLSRKILKNIWPQYKVEHLNYFTEASISYMAQHSGLKLKHNKVLYKTLSLEYLLNVGKGFGPNSFKKMSQMTSDLIPGFMKKYNLSLGYGEKIIILEN